MVTKDRSLPIPRPHLLPLRLRELLWDDPIDPPSDPGEESFREDPKTNDPASNEPAPRSSRVIGFIPVAGGTPPN